MKLTKLLREFLESERAGGIILICCAALSLCLANSIGEPYLHIWHLHIAQQPLEYWINDGLMAVFFLLIGLELKREIFVGNLSYVKAAMLPVFAAVGGMLLPAAIHLGFNYGTPTQRGAGIPMATDIAFALGVLSLLGKRVPLALKVFLTALAVIDDLGAIITIAIFYSKGLSWTYLLCSLAVLGALAVLNRLKIHNFVPYLLGGFAAWYLMLHSGVHATIAGVLLAFVIPFNKGAETSLSYKLQHILHQPVSFIILPAFALANTAIILQGSALSFTGANSLGIFFGLVAGKPIGIFLFSFFAVAAGICKKPDGITWYQLLGIGLLGGVGFTMSIFVTLLAFGDQAVIINSKVLVILSSCVSAALGLLWLRLGSTRSR